MREHDAAHAIHRQFMDTLDPHLGWLVAIGVKSDSVVVVCRRDPGIKTKSECIRLANGVPVIFRITGNISPASET